MNDSLEFKGRRSFTKDEMLFRDTHAFKDSLNGMHRFAWDLWYAKKEISPYDIPTRDQFTMKDLRQYTSAMSIYDMVDGNLRLKMCGSQLEEYFGTHGSGKFLTEFAAPEVVGAITFFFKKIMTIPCAGLARETISNATGKRGEMSNLTLPVTDKSGQTKMGLSFITLETRDFTLDSKNDLKITHSELHEAKFIDLGFGLPDW